MAASTILQMKIFDESVTPAELATEQAIEQSVSGRRVRRRRKRRKNRHETHKKLRRIAFFVAQAILIAIVIYLWTTIAE